MGTWGTGIFSNDISADIRSDFRNLIAYGRSTEEAIDIIVQEYELQDVSAETSDGWLALAHTAWSYGRLTDSLRETAITIIDQGIGEENWADASARDRDQRKKCLEAERAHLCSVQPAIKTPKKEKLHSFFCKPGQVYGWTSPAGEEFAWVVLTTHLYLPSKYASEEDGSHYPNETALLKWDGHPDTLPTEASEEITVYAKQSTITTPLRELCFDTFALTSNPYDIKAKTQSLYQLQGHIRTELVDSMLRFREQNKNHAFTGIDLNEPETWIYRCMEWSNRTIRFTETEGIVLS